MHKVVHLVIMEPGFESGFLEYKTHAYNYYSAAFTVALFPILLDTSLFQIINSGFPYYCPTGTDHFFLLLCSHVVHI